MKRFLIALMLTLAAVVLVAGPVVAADKFPTRNPKIIVPFAPGGAVDVTCRMIADVASNYFDGRKVVVENKPGGGAVIGQSFVAGSKPDGYTILAYTSSVVNNPLTKKTNYTHKSFQPVVMYCFDPNVVVVPANSPFKTLAEFLDAAKKTEVSIAAPGFSTSHHIAGLVLAMKTGAKFNFIQSESSAMQVQQIMGGHQDAGLISAGEAIGFSKDGSLRVLGVMEEERLADLPDVPTFRETGVDIVWGSFRGLAVPKDTPRDVVDYLAGAFKKVMEDPKFVANMKKAGYPLVYRGPDAFEKYADGVADVMKELLPTLKN